jgi:BlaI family transcriptional regulator, penicillinase repressor
MNLHKSVPSVSKRGPRPRPTDAELAILNVLWKRGQSTVRDVHEALSAHRQIGYTTVLKLLQIMTEKGLVVREEEARAHVYQAAHSRNEAQQSLLGDLIDRAFGGSAQKLVMQALSSQPATPEELAEIRRLLDELEEGRP